MTTFRWRWLVRTRFAVMAMALIVATGILTNTPAVAAGSGSMEWTGTRWEDPVCDTANETFDLRLYRDTNYGGTQWRVCGSKVNFCYSPYGVDSVQAALCAGGVDGETMNDYPSSFKLVSIAGGSSCRVVMYQHASYGGGGLTEWDPVNRTSMFPYNDEISSARRVC